MPAAIESKRRLFFALWPDAALRRKIAALSREVCSVPVPAANLHLTLRFLGLQDEAARHCFHNAAKQIKGCPLTLTLDRLGGWAHKRIQWLGPSAPPGALGELVDTLNAALTGCGLEAETRPFVPHVTLSRKMKNVLEAPVPEPVLWHVGDFVLAESVSSPDGVCYAVLERWAL